MKKYNASVLLDALFSFIMLSTLCINLIPLLSLSSKNLHEQYNDLELKRVLLNQLIKNNKLPDHIDFHNYVITQRDKKICIAKEMNNKKLCYPQKS